MGSQNPQPTTAGWGAAMVSLLSGYTNNSNNESTTQSCYPLHCYVCPEGVRTMLPFLTVLVIALGVTLAAPKAHKNHWNCHESPRGARFEDSHAEGTWVLLRMKTEAANTVDNEHCVDFSRVNDQEREGLEALIGQYVENLEWKNITLKMQIPCARSNATRRATYYLERLQAHGTYRTLQMPATTAKFDLTEFHRYPMRLALLEGRYLHMLDCVDRVAFLMGRQRDANDRLRALLDAFWPDEASPINHL